MRLWQQWNCDDNEYVNFTYFIETIVTGMYKRNSVWNCSSHFSAWERLLTEHWAHQNNIFRMDPFISPLVPGHKVHSSTPWIDFTETKSSCAEAAWYEVELGSGGMAPFIINLGIRFRQKFRLLYPREAPTPLPAPTGQKDVWIP